MSDDDEQAPPGVIRIPDEYGADETLAMTEPSQRQL